MDILYSEPITAAPLWMIIVFCVAGTITITALISFAKNKENIALGITIIGAIVTMGFFLLCMFFNDETGRTRYEVILDENYPASKLYEDYIVKDHRGEIWILEDKEDAEIR